jgi:hypothetical protein
VCSRLALDVFVTSPFLAWGEGLAMDRISWSLVCKYQSRQWYHDTPCRATSDRKLLSFEDHLMAAEP